MRKRGLLGGVKVAAVQWGGCGWPNVIFQNIYIKPQSCEGRMRGRGEIFCEDADIIPNGKKDVGSSSVHGTDHSTASPRYSNFAKVEKIK